MLHLARHRPHHGGGAWHGCLAWSPSWNARSSWSVSALALKGGVGKGRKLPVPVDEVRRLRGRARGEVTSQKR
jgi:hypothetical protein